MLEAVLAFLWASDMASQTFVGDEPAHQEPASAFDLIYETADGYMTVAALTDRQWAGLARVVDQPEWLEDPRFKTPALRQKNIDARLQLTQDALMTGPAAEWLEALTAAGVPCGPVSDPQPSSSCTRRSRRSDLVVKTEHPQAGRLRQARNAAGSRLPRRRSAAPRRRSASTPGGAGRTRLSGGEIARPRARRHYLAVIASGAKQSQAAETRLIEIASSLRSSQ